MTLRERVRFYQQLAVLARAGVPMRASLLRLKDRISGQQMSVLTEKVNAGEMIGDAFAKAGFSPLESHLVAAGERSAQLETVFQHLSEFWKWQLELGQDIRTQLYYPAALLHLAILVWALMGLLAGSTQSVIIHLVAGYGVLYASAFALYLFIRSSRKNEIAQQFWLTVPLIGGMLSTACLYRWITALRLEYIAGIPLPNAVADAWQASGFVGSERLAGEGEQALREGTELSALVQRWKQLPRDWVDFIESGEIAGALETALTNLEEEAGRERTLAQKRLTEWAPKILSVVILIAVGAMIISATQKLNEATGIDAIQKQIDQATGQQ